MWRDGADEVLERVEGAVAEQPEQADQEDHRRRKASSELKATCWREAHAVVRQEPPRLRP